MPLWEKIALYVVAINIATYFAYWLDKRAARGGGWRVPEKNLFVMALLGGTPAAFFASQKLRHKNKKASFRMKIWMILFAQLAVLAYFLPQHI